MERVDDAPTISGSGNRDPNHERTTSCSTGNVFAGSLLEGLTVKLCWRDRTQRPVVGIYGHFKAGLVPTISIVGTAPQP